MKEFSWSRNTISKLKKLNKKPLKCEKTYKKCKYDSKLDIVLPFSDIL